MLTPLQCSLHRNHNEGIFSCFPPLFLSPDLWVLSCVVTLFPLGMVCPLLQGSVTNSFSGSCLLICWPYHTRIFIARTTAEAEAPTLWPLDAKSQLIRKDPDAGTDWSQEEKATTEDERVGWHHGLNGHEFEQTPGDGEGQGILACCSPWGFRVRLDWSAINHTWIIIIKPMF